MGRGRPWHSPFITEGGEHLASSSMPALSPPLSQAGSPVLPTLLGWVRAAQNRRWVVPMLCFDLTASAPCKITRRGAGDRWESENYQVHKNVWLTRLLRVLITC